MTAPKPYAHSCPRTCIGLGAGLVVVGAFAWGNGGAVGTGAFLGYLLGAGLGGLGVAWQAHWLRHNPARAAQAQIESILAKFAALALFALTFRYVDSLSGSVDWQAFLLAFAAAVLWVLPLSIWDLSRLVARAKQTKLAGVEAAPRRSV